nr:hypothetical protein [Tanacetum cinerariifolium]
MVFGLVAADLSFLVKTNIFSGGLTDSKVINHHAHFPATYYYFFTASKDEVAPAAQHSKGNDQWDTLKHYMGLYKSFHPILPVIVAETLLSASRLMKLPLWLVKMFKGTLKGTLGMAGSESSPASLLQLYVDYGRYAEATNLVLHYLESVASLGLRDLHPT